MKHEQKKRKQISILICAKKKYSYPKYRKKIISRAEWGGRTYCPMRGEYDFNLLVCVCLYICSSIIRLLCFFFINKYSLLSAYTKKNCATKTCVSISIANTSPNFNERKWNKYLRIPGRWWWWSNIERRRKKPVSRSAKKKKRNETKRTHIRWKVDLAATRRLSARIPSIQCNRLRADCSIQV